MGDDDADEVSCLFIGGDADKKVFPVARDAAQIKLRRQIGVKPLASPNQAEPEPEFSECVYTVHALTVDIDDNAVETRIAIAIAKGELTLENAWSRLVTAYIDHTPFTDQRTH